MNDTSTGPRRDGLSRLRPLILLSTLAACGTSTARFSDLPVVWNEGDDRDVPRRPKPRRLEDEKVALFMSDFFRREIDRHLALESPPPAADVNALDEIPCSTWFCARNHLQPLSPQAIAAGPPAAVPPTPPLWVTGSKTGGVTTGFKVEDARGRKYLIKVDPPGHPRLASGAEVVGQLIFHAAGYNVPGAFAIELDTGDVRVKPGAKRLLSGVAERPFTEHDLGVLLLDAARTTDGKITAAAVPWLEGETLGGFDMAGRRADDPNDRIPHQDRRSLRASLVLFAWLDVYDASAINTLDTYVAKDGRRFVRHHFIDFGSGLGSSGVTVKSVHDGRESLLDLGRMATAFFTFGVDQRDWQRQVVHWRKDAERTPAVGWFGSGDGWDIDQFRTGRKVPAHLRMTSADWYWGAKLAASFTDEQLASIVAAARYPEPAAAIVRATLAARRDRIASRYLRTMTACERPAVSGDGAMLCFEDAVLSRGYGHPDRTMYTVRVVDEAGRQRGSVSQPALPGRTCVRLPPAGGARYLIATVEASLDNRKAKPARVHLRWRARESRFVVVGLERDDL